MSSDLQWSPKGEPDSGSDQLRPFSESLAPVVARPTESSLQNFASVIENIIVPRLLMSHAQQITAVEKERITLRNVAVTDFILLTMLDDPEAAVDYVRHLLNSGVAFQDILLELMAPAARILGERWTDDKVSFVEVALGVARMHRILRAFDSLPSHLWSQAGAGRKALLMPAPGELHTFGLRLVQEFLMRESWTVANKAVPDLLQLAEVVSDEHFDIVGLSLSGETLIDTFMSAIRVIRGRSRNPNVKVIVGGHLFVVRPELVAASTADAYAVDAPATVRIVNSWAQQLPALT